MSTDIQARGFTLTGGLLAATETRLRDFNHRFPDLQTHVQVRFFDVNGQRGGVDKGCLVSAHIGRRRKVVVASEIDADLYRAIDAAFDKLTRATRSALNREHAAIRRDAERTASAKLAIHDSSPAL